MGSKLNLKFAQAADLQENLSDINVNTEGIQNTGHS